MNGQWSQWHYRQMWRGWFIQSYVIVIYFFFSLSLSLPLHCRTIATIITIVADFPDLLLLNPMVSACHYHQHYHNWIHKLIYPYHMHLPICALAIVKSITPTYFIIRERTQCVKLFAISQQMELSLWAQSLCLNKMLCIMYNVHNIKYYYYRANFC